MILPGRRPSGSNPPIRQAEPPGDALPFVKNESVDHPVHPLRRSRCLFRRRNARADIKLPRPVPAKNARTRAGTLGCWLIRETGKTENLQRRWTNCSTGWSGTDCIADDGRPSKNRSRPGMGCDSAPASAAIYNDCIEQATVFTHCRIFLDFDSAPVRCWRCMWLLAH